MSTEREYPLGDLQRGFWIDQLLEPASAKYNGVAAFRLRGDVDAAALAEAWAHATRAWPLVRAVVVQGGGAPRFRVRETGPALRVVDARGLGEAELEAAVRGEAYAPFRLDEAVARATLFQTHEGGHFVATVHHVVQDLAAADLLYATLLDAFGRLRRGEPLPPLPAADDFGAFLEAHDAEAGGSARAEHEAYWRRTLDGATTRLELPADRPRPAGGKPETRVVDVRLLDVDGTRRLREVARATGTSTFRWLFAAYACLLHRQSGEDDLLVGTALDCRPAGMAALYATCINPAAIRLRFDGPVRFVDVLRQVDERVREAQAHRGVPWSDLVRDGIAPADPVSRVPFRADFGLLKRRLRPDLEGSSFRSCAVPWTADFGGVEASASFPMTNQEGVTELTLWAAEVSGALAAEVKYDARRFEPVTVERFLAQLGVLLGASLDDPEALVGTLRLEEPASVERKLARWNPAPRTWPLGDVLDGIARSARERPDAVALRWGDETLRYGELRARVSRLAAWLGDRGVGPGDLVGLMTRRSLDLVTAILAVLEVGAGYVPLEPTYPAERLAFMLGDTRPKLVLGQAEAGLALDAPFVSLESAAAEAAGLAPRPAPAASPDAVAYVVYTSGSTGVPKGVPITRRGLTNVAFGLAEAWGVGPGSVVLSFATFNFDGHVATLFPVLATGGEVHLGTPDALRGGASLARLLESARVTHAVLPPSVLLGLGEAALPDLRVVVSVGEALAPELVARFARGRRVVNGYGPTEITVCATLDDCVPGELVRIGAPFVNVRARVCDDALAPVPDGVVGELLLAGDGLTPGYLARPEQNAARFVRTGPADERHYRTGDLARFGADGRLEFVGRRDAQVKLRGLRVELGEVEEALRRAPGVRDAAVELVELGGRPALAGAVVREAGAAFDEAAVRASLQGTLPDYMVPGSIRAVDVLPLTPNGKVDRPALRRLFETLLAPAEAPAGAAPARAAETPAAGDAVALALGEVWSELLGQAPEADANFFEVGGDSLLAVELADQLAQRLGAEVSPTLLFEAPVYAAYEDALRLAFGGAPAEPATADARLRLALFYPSGGDVGIYRHLVGLLPKTLAVELVAPPAETAAAHAASLEALAETHADALAAGGGELALGGWSFGGALAHATAVALERRGHAVRFVLLVDTERKVAPRADASPLERVAPDVGPLATFFEALPEAVRATLGERLLATPADARAAEAGRLLEGHVDAELLAHVKEQATLHASHVRLLAAYQPGVVAAPLHGLWTEATLATNDGGPRAWEGAARAPLVTSRAPGAHFTVMRPPYVERVAEAFVAAVSATAVGR